MISDERIIDAYLCVVDTHHTKQTDRQMRVLRETDFERIRRIKRSFDMLWHVEQEVYGPKETYYLFRRRTFNRWQIDYRWTDETRNLYASIIAKLANWNRHRGTLSKADRKRLDRIRPGALPLLRQLLPKHTQTLI